MTTVPSSFDFDHRRYTMTAERIVALLRQALDGYAEDEVSDMIDRINLWLARGDGVAVYENMDLGHRELGHRQFISYGSAAAAIQGYAPPERLPDFPQRINWRYCLIGVFQGASL